MYVHQVAQEGLTIFLHSTAADNVGRLYSWYRPCRTVGQAGIRRGTKAEQDTNKFNERRWHGEAPQHEEMLEKKRRRRWTVSV